MSGALFIRLLDTAVENKGAALAEAVAQTAVGAPGQTVYAADAQGFRQIPGSPFAYWASEYIQSLFSSHEQLQTEDRVVCFGLSTKDDFRFLRCSWETDPIDLGQVWFSFAKGGSYSPYYYDVHLSIDWEEDGVRLKKFAEKRTTEIFGKASWSRWINNWLYYFRPGLTWPRRTNGFSVRILPTGCIFADKGPAIFVPGDNEQQILALLGVMNSSTFEALVRIQLARTQLAQSYEVGLIQNTPVPKALDTLDTSLVRKAHDLTRDSYRGDETTHAFSLPWLATAPSNSLDAPARALDSDDARRANQLTEIRRELDEVVFDLYELGPEERAWVAAEVGEPPLEAHDDSDDEEEVGEPEDFPFRVQNLLMWCVGVAFGRWDARFALNPDLLPALQGPFDPLPRVAPGGLVGPDGLSAARDSIASEEWLAARESVLHIPDLPLPGAAPATIPTEAYPLPVAWDGILVDDPTHPSDIVARVRDVLALLWGDRAGAIEQEACDILGVNSLRDYVRDLRNGFFAFHIKRYSKSRRKAPIYWLLQSANRNYAIWLYIHRMDDQTYFTAARDYADTKVNLEAARLDELREGLPALSGSAQKRREREIEQQEKLVDEVTTFRNTLDKIALLGLPPDLNDGVVLGIAPLHELVPWKEADKYWHALLDGEYEWSTMAQRMRERGLVK